MALKLYSHFAFFFLADLSVLISQGITDLKDPNLTDDNKLWPKTRINVG